MCLWFLRGAARRMEGRLVVHELSKPTCSQQSTADQTEDPKWMSSESHHKMLAPATSCFALREQANAWTAQISLPESDIQQASPREALQLQPAGQCQGGSKQRGLRQQVQPRCSTPGLAMPTTCWAWRLGRPWRRRVPRGRGRGGRRRYRRRAQVQRRFDRAPRAAPRALRQVKSRYKQLAKKHHPDLCPPAERAAAEATFKELTAAYNRLTSRERAAARARPRFLSLSAALGEGHAVLGLLGCRQRSRLGRPGARSLQVGREALCCPLCPPSFPRSPLLPLPAQSRRTLSLPLPPQKRTWTGRRTMRRRWRGGERRRGRRTTRPARALRPPAPRPSSPTGWSRR